MKMTVSWFSVPSATAGEKFDLDCLDSGAKRELSAGLAPYAGMTVRVRVTKSQPRKTDEDKAAKIQAKTNKKAAATKAREEKLHAIATKQAEKDAAKLAKKAEKESEKEAAKKAAEKTEAAAKKAIDSKPTKKSHHNPAKGY